MGKIAEVVVPAGGQATIDFANIPQTYRHLAVIVRGRGTDTGGFYTTLHAQINGDIGASYDGQRLDASASNGNGTNVAGATSFDLGYFESGGAPAGSQSSNDYELLYYTDTTLRKQIKGRYNLAQGNAGIWTGIMDGEWRNTAAISRLTLFLAAGNFAAGTVATLYGVDPQAGAPVPSGALQKIAEVVVPTGGQAAIDFTAIPQTFRSLRLDYEVRSDAAGTNQVNLQLQVNGDTGSTYDADVIGDYGSTTQITPSVGATSALIGYCAGSTAPAGDAGFGSLMAHNYTGTTFRKHISGANGHTTADSANGLNVGGVMAQWRNTAAITSLHVFPASGNFVAGSVVSLYGVV